MRSLDCYNHVEVKRSGICIRSLDPALRHLSSSSSSFLFFLRRCRSWVKSRLQGRRWVSQATCLTKLSRYVTASSMSSVFFPFPVPLTGRQYFYILIIQGLVAALIDAGANFGIAYAMYHSQGTVKMWVFSENTIAGDLGVTPLIQTAVSMIISSALIHSDLHNHAIRPLPFVWPHAEHLPDPRRFVELFGRTGPVCEETKGDSGSSSPITEKQNSNDVRARGIRYYLLMLLRFIFEGTENNMLLDWHGPRIFIQRLLLTGIQGLGLGVVFGFPLWCLAVIILGPIYGTGNMGNRWAPQASSGLH